MLKTLAFKFVTWPFYKCYLTDIIISQTLILVITFVFVFLDIYIHMEAKNDLAPPRLSYCRSCSAGKATMKSLSSSSLGWTLQPRSAFELWESNYEKLYISCNLTSFQNTNLNVCALPFPTTPCNISAYLVLLNGWYIFKPDDTPRSDDVQCTYYVFGLATPTHIWNSWRSFINFNLRTSCCLPSPYSVDCACCRIVCNISCLWFMVWFSLPPPTTYPPKKFQIWKSSHRSWWDDTCKV